MRKGRNGEKKKTGGKKKGGGEGGNSENSGHYIIASSRPLECRLLERRMLVPIMLFSLPYRKGGRQWYISPQQWPW